MSGENSGILETGVYKPAGGYRLISVFQLFAPWWAYRNGHIRFRDLRACFALHEMASRRCALGKGRNPNYTTEELQGLLGIADAADARALLKKLGPSGLVQVARSSIQFATKADELIFDVSGFRECFEGITNHRRRIPVPRRTLRLLASARSPALVATILGHLLRCVYAKGRIISSQGSVSATWIADLFEVDSRNVKRARTCLREMAWLIPCPSDHWHRQRYGGRVLVNLQWQSSARKSKSPPPSQAIPLKSPPPYVKQELLKEFNNQEPAVGGLIGVVNKSRENPNLQNIQPGDLANTGRLLSLYQQAAKREYIGSSEHDQLQFISAAVHARRHATRNPGGFLAYLVRGRLWHHATSADETEAQAMLKKHLYGDPPSPVRCPKPPRQTDRVSVGDIRLVAQLTRTVEFHAFQADPFELLQKEDSSWTRDRWNRTMRAWLTPPARWHSSLNAESTPNA